MMGCQQDAFDDDLPGERNRFEMCRRRGVMLGSISTVGFLNRGLHSKLL